MFKFNNFELLHVSSFSFYRETYTLEKVKQNFNSEVTKLKQERVSDLSNS